MNASKRKTLPSFQQVGRLSLVSDTLVVNEI